MATKVGRDVVDRERGDRVLARDARVEQDLEQQVAQLLAHARAVARLDGLGELVRLLEQVADQGLVRLLAVPRAPAGRVEPVHDGDGLAQRVDGTGVVRLARGHAPIVGKRTGGPLDGSPPVCCLAGAGYLQVSVRVTAPFGPTVAVRLAPLSQTTVPAPSFLTYLYSKVVPAGRSSVTFQTG